MLKPAVLQFGTGRFLLAHVDLLVSEALATGDAVGGIFVVQTTASPQSTARTAALATGSPYPVHIRGIEQGQPVDRTVQVRSVVNAVQARTDWSLVREAIVSDVRIIVSNTGDQGYLLDPSDEPTLQAGHDGVPRSYPAKLLVLLHLRWMRMASAPLSILPCELIQRNGDTLRSVVCELAREWRLPTPFVHWLREHCVWANTLVDRIVSEPLHPVGAVAEPYALWAIERRPGLVLPCVHPAIELTDALDRHERLKLFLLNGAHTFLAEHWRDGRLSADATVAQAMNHATVRPELESLWAEEIIPLFAALGQRKAAERYLVTLRERLLNPFLAHRLADIAQNHLQKKARRLAPIVALAGQKIPALRQPRLQAALAECRT